VKALYVYYNYVFFLLVFAFLFMLQLQCYVPTLSAVHKFVFALEACFVFVIRMYEILENKSGINYHSNYVSVVEKPFFAPALHIQTLTHLPLMRNLFRVSDYNIHSCHPLITTVIY